MSTRAAHVPPEHRTLLAGGFLLVISTKAHHAGVVNVLLSLWLVRFRV